MPTGEGWPLTLAGWFEQQARICGALGSPMYEALFTEFARPDRTATLASLSGDEWRFGDALPLRLTGAAHWLALTGNAPELAAQFETCGGSLSLSMGDLADLVVATIEANPATLANFLERAVQTNETGRSRALILGLRHTQQRFSLPVNLLEFGTSAGLNLRMASFGYRQEGHPMWGPPSPHLTFDSPWERYPSWARDSDERISIDVVAAAGCDPNPHDVTEPEHRDRMLAYLWPDQMDRFERFRGAVATAAEVPARIDAVTDTAGWLADRLAERPAGTATVVFHSICWQYIDTDERWRITEAIEAAANSADSQRPVARLSFEPDEVDRRRVAVRLRQWPRGEEQLIALSGYHGEWVTPLG